jgi:hypothetical protein
MISGSASAEFRPGLGKEETWGRGSPCSTTTAIGFVPACGSCNTWALSEGWFRLSLTVKLVSLLLRIETMCWRAINPVPIAPLSNV